MASSVKKAFTLLIFIMLMVSINESWAQSRHPGNAEEVSSAMTRIAITIGNTVFRAKLHDNEAASAWLKLLPVTLTMSDLNGNEKYTRLAKSLPARPTEKPETIKAGELMIWSGNTLVLFYKTFSNAYGGYVRLGYVEDTSSLANALGEGNVTVSFARSK